MHEKGVVLRLWINCEVIVTSGMCSFESHESVLLQTVRLWYYHIIVMIFTNRSRLAPLPFSASAIFAPLEVSPRDRFRRKNVRA